MCQILFFNKVAGLRPAALLGKNTLAQVFSCEFCEIFEENLFYRTSLGECFWPFQNIFRQPVSQCRKSYYEKQLILQKNYGLVILYLGYHCFLDNRDTFILLIGFGSNWQRAIFKFPEYHLCIVLLVYCFLDLYCRWNQGGIRLLRKKVLDSDLSDDIWTEYFLLELQ